MKKCIGILLAALFFSGCSETGQYAGGGAVAGGALGAIIGHNSGRRGGEGAVIGAAVGALAGTAIGQQKQIDKMQQGGTGQMQIAVCPSCNSRVDVSGFPPHSTVACPNCKTEFTY
ncbi:MAG: glycine zipper 2TM domain-containing protein [Candidatus Aureabacteria bacterium]|nr:glycine zipper 2TM domain-containing protein [Candidatus Auribacterota bacterium]